MHESARQPPWLSHTDSGALDTANPASDLLSISQFEDLLEREERVLVIETQDVDGTLAQFESFARQSGKSAYAWRTGIGLTSLRVADMSVPGSRRFPEALRYIAKSPHYGLYAFVGYEKELVLDAIQLVREIARDRSGHDRKILFITEAFKSPRGLEQLIARIRHQPQRRLRLRDGRWVV